VFAGIQAVCQSPVTTTAASNQTDAQLSSCWCSKDDAFTGQNRRRAGRRVLPARTVAAPAAEVLIKSLRVILLVFKFDFFCINKPFQLN